MSDGNNTHDENNYISDISDSDTDVNKLEEKCMSAKPKLRSDNIKATSKNRGRPSLKTKNKAKFELDPTFLRPNQKASSTVKSKTTNNHQVDEEGQTDFRSMIAGVSFELKDDLSKITSKLNSLFTMINSLVDRVEELENESTLQKNDIMNQGRRILELEQKTEENDRKSKVNSVLLTHSKIDSSSKSLSVDIGKFMTEELKLNAHVVDMTAISRFGRGNGTVLLELPSFEAKKQLYRAKKQLCATKNPEYDELYINDFLTRKKSELLKKARDLKKTKRIHTAFSMDGNVFIRIQERGERMLIREMSDLEIPENEVP